jgi:hypothetical protein
MYNVSPFFWYTEGGNNPFSVPVFPNLSTIELLLRREIYSKSFGNVATVKQLGPTVT